MTRIGPGTPAGKLLRRYWQPVALVDEMQGAAAGEGGAPARRGPGAVHKTNNAYGLLERHCPHRGADLAYGRIEDGGLRCSFHGWKFDVARQVPRDAGRAGRQPAVRAHQDTSPIRSSRRAASCSPTSAKASAPAFPHFDCFVAPDAYTFAFKGYWDCNWLQALEVGIDPAHASWLHKYLRGRGPGGELRPAVPRHAGGFRPADEQGAARVRPPGDPRRAHRLRHAPADAAQDQRRADARARHQHPLPAGLRHPDERRDDDHAVARAGRRHRLLLVLDLHQLRRAGRQGHDAQPAPAAPIRRPTTSRSSAARTAGASTPRSSRSKTFTGMGFDINIHDQFACESQGRIAGPHAARTSAPPTRASCSTGACWSMRSGRTRRARAADGARSASARAHRPARDRRHRPDASASTSTGRKPTRTRRRQIGLGGMNTPEGDRSARSEGGALFVCRPARRAARQDARRRAK